MSLFNITTRNIKKNFRTYFLYFVSMVFTIVVFYTFSSIQYNEQVANTVGMRTQIILQVGAIAIAIFSAIFMGYSNSFFTRKRKKEIGLYTLLGLQRKQVARMLFYENLVMGVIALGIGIIIGTVLSKLFIMLFLRLMGHFVQVSFTIAPQAIINTVIVFLIMFIIISLYAYSLIYRFKLVDLFRAEQSGEPEPKASVLVALIAIAFICAGYAAAFSFDVITNFWVYVLSVLGLVIAGTYGLFHSFMIFAIRYSRKNKPKYYNGMNLISTSNLMYRIKSNATLLASIAILSATTLTAVGMSYGFYHDITKDVDQNNPFSYVYLQQGEELDEKVDKTIARYPENRLLNSVELEFISPRGRIPGTEIDDHYQFTLISESSFNKIAELKGWDRISLSQRDEAVFMHSTYIIGDFEDKDAILEVGESEKKFHIADAKALMLTNSFETFTTLVVKDDVYVRLSALEKPRSLRALIVENQKESGDLTAELEKLFPEYGLDAYYTDYMMNMEGSGMLMFIGGFLGLVILLSTGSIIYFRQLNEAQKDQVNYRILKNIGVCRREIRTSISKQVLYVFLFPLIIGIAHSSAALAVLSSMSNKNLVISTIITVAVYTIIYFGYYLLTVNSYDRIVNSD